MGKRLRISEFRKGDVYSACRDGEATSHIWIIMQDCMEGDKHCTRAFNLTGSESREARQHMEDVSHHKFPADYFKHKKKYTYARINVDDCLKKGNTLKHLGNIQESCPGLMEEICQATYACEVAVDLEEICDCDYQIMDKKIELNQIEPPSCDCVNQVYFTQERIWLVKLRVIALVVQLCPETRMELASVAARVLFSSAPVGLELPI